MVVGGVVKRQALSRTRTLNPRPQAVVDKVFTSTSFCDPLDLVQVKYERLRLGPPRLGLGLGLGLGLETRWGSRVDAASRP